LPRRERLDALAVGELELIADPTGQVSHSMMLAIIQRRESKAT
jgi:hypothetical protein